METRLDTLLSKAGPSYFTVLAHQAENPDEGPETGSGFAVSTKGYLLTAGHVGGRVGNLVEVRGIDQVIYKGRVIALSKIPDIALLKIERLISVPVHPVEHACVELGSPVLSLGNPKFGKNTARFGTLVSLQNRRFVSERGFGYSNAMQIVLDTQVGESGGPVFTEQGQLAGMIVTGTHQKGSGRSLTQALPVTALSQFACANTACSAPWRRLAAEEGQKCIG